MLTPQYIDQLMRISKESGVALGISNNMIATPEIRQVIYSPPATIIIWKDNTKTVVKCTEGDEYSRTTGLALCIVKKAYGNKRYRELLRQHLKEE